MTSINPNFDYKYPYLPQQQTNIDVGNSLYAENGTSEVQLPEIYQYTDDEFAPKTLKEQVEKMDMMGLISPWFEHPILMAGTAGVLSYGIDKFAEGCGGEYEKSMLYKAAKFGDNIENSKIIKSKPVQTAYEWAKVGGKKIAKVFHNSDVLNAILYTPSQPEWAMPKDELLNQSQRVVHEFGNIVDTLKLTDDLKCAQINEIGLDKTEKKWLKEFFNTENLSKISEKERVNATLLNRLGISKEEIKQILDKGEGATAATKDKIIKALGMSPDDLKNLRGEVSEETIKKVLEATKKVKGKVRIGAGEYWWLGPFQPFKRFIGCDGVHNKLYSMRLGEGAQTQTGKLLTTFLQKCYRGFTFGGGKLGVLFWVAPHIAHTIVNIKKADKDQKVGTAVNGLVSSMSWVFTFPLALEALHRIGGMQYAGMSKEQVAKYRELLKAFNDKVTNSANPEFFQTREAYNKAKEALVKELKELKPDPKKQTFITKICKKLGRFVTLDLERIKSYRNSKGLLDRIENATKRMPSIFRNGIGVPLRLIGWGVISMAVLDPIINKGIKKIFGNYYDDIKEEEHESNKKQQKQALKDDLQARLLEAQLAKTQLANKTPDISNQIQPEKNQAPEAVSKSIPENKLNEKPIEEIPTSKNDNIKSPVLNQTENTQNNYSLNPNPTENITAPAVKKRNKIDNYTYIPSSENTIQNKNSDVTVNKYIPAQTAGNFTKTFDNSHLAAALRRADRAEKHALEILSGNFN